MKVTQDGKTMILQKSEYMATIFDGHSHIERRIFTDETGVRYVRINGWFLTIGFLATHGDEVDTWYDGGGRF